MTESIRTAAADLQVIRVFISSTFRDMHAERDAINRLVFPELRRRCLMRGAEFIGVDMRWGVTEDEIQREGTLAICLHEIERSRPFFVCLLAERFGSVYPPEEVSPALVEAARAVPALQSIVDQWYRLDETVVPPVYRLHRVIGHMMADEEAAALVHFWESRGLTGAGDSLTAREILRGVFEDGYPPTRALFYLRRAGLTHQPGFPAALIPVFVEQDEERRQKLATLKRRIRRQRPRHVVQRYRATYAGLRLDPALIPPDLPAEEQAALSTVVTPEQWSRLSERARDVLTHQGTVALSGMDALAERMIDDLWRAIEPELERPATQLDAHQRERAYHERFVARHTEFFRGREVERTRVLQYVADTEDREVLVVTGDPGAGKSAFLAECVRVCRERHPKALVVPHFIGAAPESASLPATLRSLSETLRREAGLEETVEADPDKLRFQLRTFLEQVGAKRPVILFLDAVNQLDPAGRGQDLDWLPVWAPPGTRIVVSTLVGDCLKQLTRRVPPDHVVTIPALPVDQRRTLVMDFLARRRKTLTPEQLKELLDVEQRREAGLPLYVLVALEELCLFGDHEALIARIRRLPPTLPELFDQVLARVEQDHTRATVESVCSWLAVARAGLLESEVLDLLGAGGAFPRIRWTRLYRALEPYLKPFDEEPGAPAAGRLDFYHGQLRAAVYRRCLHMAAEPDATVTKGYRDAHRQLAAYFRAIAYDETPPGRWRTDRVRGLSELPFHQTRGEMWEQVYETLTDFDFLAAKCTHVAVGTDTVLGVSATYGGIYELLDDFRRVIARFPKAHTEVILAFSRALGREAAHLSRSPHLLWQQLRNRLQWDGPQLRDMLAREETHRQGQASSVVCRTRTPSRESPAFVRVLTGHTLPVNACVFSPDGSKVISASSDCTVRAWSSLSGECLRILTGHVKEVNSCAVTPDGLRVISASTDSTLRVWDLRSGEHLRTLKGHSDSVDGCTVSPDSRFVVSASYDRTLRVWELASGECIHVLEGHGRGVWGCAVSADGLVILSGSQDGTLRFWDAATGECLRVIRADSGIWAAGLSADQRFVLSAHRDRKLRIWDTATGELMRVLVGHTGEVMSCVIDPSGERALSASQDRTVRLWDIASGQCLRTLGGHSEEVLSCAMSTDGALAVSCSNDRTLRVWDLRSVEAMNTLDGHALHVSGCAVGSDGLRAVTSSWDCTLRVWDLASFTSLRTLEGHTDRVLSCATGPDRDLAYSASNDGTLAVWSLTSGIRLHQLIGHTAAVTHCALGPDGRALLSTSHDHTIRAWDTTSYAALSVIETPDVTPSELPNHVALPVAVRSSEDGVAAIATDGIALGLSRRFLEACAVHPDGQRVLSAGWDGVLRVWDLPSRRCLATLKGHTGAVWACATSPDGQQALSASDDGTLRIWNLTSGTCVGSLRGHAGAVWACAVTPDGRLVLSGGDDGTMRLWSLDQRKEIAKLPVAGAVRCVSLHPWAPMAIAGDNGGNVYFVDLEGVEYGPLIVSASTVDEEILVRCPRCGHQHPVPNDSPGTAVSCPGCSARLSVRAEAVNDIETPRVK